ncbi:hypothetical protein Sjap_014530 [Stephania japonica]|uniref:4-coumarate--CoA ligase n=1 Tax=Stephania japonica TaxID=461633 RepID=A0AAP0NQI6_9MAGN
MEELRPSPPNSSPLTPLGFLDRAATVYGDCPSIIYNDTSYTWAQTHRRCLQLASSLVSLGIRPGNVVSVLAPNVPPMYELHFAVPMSGAVLNNINTRLDSRTVSVLLSHCESKLLFVDIISYPVLQDALKEIVDPPIVVLITDIYVTAPSDSSPTIDHTYEGTTSAPKGVVHCHRGLFIVTVDSLIDWIVPKQPVYLWTLPMFHTNGWSFPWGMAAVGGTNVCLRKVDAATIYDEINKHHVTHMCGAPVVLNMLANYPNRKSLTRPVHILTAGSPPPAVIKDRSKDVIISGGENLSSIEVESVLYSHPRINEAAVVAQPDEFWGETPCAFVSLKAESSRVTEKEIIEYCREKDATLYGAQISGF